MKLRIEIGQYGALVFGRVLEMPEKLRKEGVLLNGPAFRLASGIHPELGPSYLYIGGFETEMDQWEFSHQYDSPEHAACVIEAITDLVKTVNRGTPETKEVKLRVIE